MSDDLIYILLVWLTALIIAPILVVGCLFNDGFLAMIWALMLMIPLSVLLGVMISFPSLSILWLAMYLTRKYSNLSISQMKLLWTAISIPLSIGPFLLLFGGLQWADGGVFALSYGSVIIAAIWFYKIPAYPQLSKEI